MGLRLNIEVLSQDLSGAWVIVRWVRASQGTCRPQSNSMGESQPGLDASPQRGVKEISRSRLRYEAQECRVPSMGLRMCQLVATLCVALALALVALGGCDPLTGFSFEP
jgi:hypothetical protein